MKATIFINNVPGQSNNLNSNNNKNIAGANIVALTTQQRWSKQ